MSTVRDHDGDTELASSYLVVPIRVVLAAVSYYAEFNYEIDADAAWAEQIESDERARWERERAALA